MCHMVLTRSPLIPSEYKGMHLAIHSCGTGGLPVGTKSQPADTTPEESSLSKLAPLKNVT